MKEEVSQKTIKIARTRGGIPCLWESNVSFTELDRATVILNKSGNPKPAVFVHAEKEKQALVPIQSGDFVSKVFKDKHGIAMSVFKIIEISPMENTAVILPVYRKSSTITEYTIPSEYENMINTCIFKLNTPLAVISFLNKKPNPTKS